MDFTLEDSTAAVVMVLTLTTLMAPEVMVFSLTILLEIPTEFLSVADYCF